MCLAAFFFYSITNSVKGKKKAADGRPSCRRVQHIFDENAISPGWIIDKDMGHRAHQVAVLDDGTSAHG
jgi:hypothetical protein